MKKLMMILVLILAGNSWGFGQGMDTVWTYNLQPDYLKNGVFSPDDQFVFATHYDYNFPAKLKLSKFDKVTGQKIWTTDTIMGIKQFSDDGKFFYTYDLKKYSYPEFELVGNIGGTVINKRVKGYTISEFDDFGIAYLFESKVDSNLAVFSPKEMMIKNIISYTNPAGIADNAICSPTSNEFITSKHLGYQLDKIQYYDYYFDLWSKDNLKKIKQIFQQSKTIISDEPIIHYSPDGKLLGILTDSLRLFETENYSLVYTLPIKYIRLFRFSNDSKNLFLSTESKGIYIFNMESKEIHKPKFYCLSIDFLSKDQNEFILTNHGYSLALLKQVETSVADTSMFKIESNNDYIQLRMPETLKIFSNIKISDIKGNYQNFSIMNNQNNSIIIDISRIVSGAYILSFDLNNKVYTHKFIIVR